jgi:hypothetical protein
MAIIYRKEEKVKKEEQMNIVPPPEKRPLWQTSFHFFTLVLILVFANWGKPGSGDNQAFGIIFGPTNGILPPFSGCSWFIH